MSSISTAFTAVGVGNALSVPSKESFTYTVTGTFVGTWVVEYASGGNTQAWTQVPAATGTGTQSAVTIVNDSNEDRRYRFQCTAYTSGTLTGVVADIDTDIKYFHGQPLQAFNAAGTMVFGVTEAGLTTFYIGGTQVTVTAAELNYLDLAALGTGAASKAVVLDAGEDYTWPVAGVLTYGGTGITATGAEINYLDLAALGTGAASKAIVLDASGEYTMPDAGILRFSADTVAAAGTTSADAAALADQITIVTGATGAAGVVLPAAADLEERTVINDSNTFAVLVYPVDSGDDTINDLAANQRFVLYPRQKVTFKAISATAWHAEKTASAPTKETHFQIFDDFLPAAINTGAGVDNWIVFAGTDANADAAATVTAPEGIVAMGSGNANGTEDGSVLSLILTAKGSLVSLGTTVFEARVSLDQLTGCSQWIGLCDVLATDAERMPHTVDSGTVADGGLTVTDVVGVSFSSDATATTLFTFTSENTGTIGNSAAEEAASVGPTADTYDTIRIEVDSDGDARIYINGVLEKTIATAVATTALLIPYIGMDSGTDAQTDTVLSIDYIEFQGARPAGQ